MYGKTPTPPSALCIMIFFPLQTEENAVQKTTEKSSFCCCCSPLFASPRRDSNRRLMAYICSVFTAQQKTLTCYRRALSASRTASSLGQTRLSAGPVCDVTRWQVNTVGHILFISRGVFFCYIVKTVVLHFIAPKATRGRVTVNLYTNRGRCLSGIAHWVISCFLFKEVCLYLCT